MNHGNGEVEVRSAEDAVKAMKRDREFIKGRYVNLRMMENTPKPGSSLNKGELESVVNKHSRRVPTLQ